jgi:hypothetical protein
MSAESRKSNHSRGSRGYKKLRTGGDEIEMTNLVE